MENAIKHLTKKKEMLAEHDKPFPENDAAKLKVLSGALEENQDILNYMPNHWKEWMDIYSKESGQRYPSLSGVGSLIHSEVRADLKEMGYKKSAREKLMRILKMIDREMIAHSEIMKAKNPDQGIQVPQMPKKAIEA